MLIEIGILISGIIIGIFIEWIWTRPEPKSESGMIIPHPYIDEDEWNECMKECSSYHKANSKKAKIKRRGKKK